MNENLKALELLLAHHDWYYDYSDDYSAWTRGNRERATINAEQKRLIAEGLATVDEIVDLSYKYRPKT